MKPLQHSVAVASRTFSRNAELRSYILQHFSQVKFNDEGKSLAGGELVKFLSGCRGAIIALEKINEAIVRELPELRVLSKYGVGLDNIDQGALAKHGVQLGWTGGVNARAVSEIAVCLMIGALRQVFRTSRELALNKRWVNEGGTNLSGKTVGLVGCGFVGSDLAQILKALGCQILIHDILDKSEVARAVGGRQVLLDELLRSSDVVSLHVPSEPATFKMIDAPQLALMKPSALLINTARGPVVSEPAILVALNNQRLAGYATDVYDVEPPLESPLLDHPAFIGTPHIGGSSSEAIAAMGRSAVDNLHRLLAHQVPVTF
jgi:D-3-phosphoglycerate dehydrogenase